MPYRRRIVVVSEYLLRLDHFLQVLTIILLLVGRPISVKQHDKPTTEEVREAQEKYIAELTRYLTIRHIPPDGTANVRTCSIWDTYKDEFAKARLRELEIIE